MKSDALAFGLTLGVVGLLVFAATRRAAQARPENVARRLSSRLDDLMGSRSALAPSGI